METNQKKSGISLTPLRLGISLLLLPVLVALWFAISWLVSWRHEQRLTEMTQAFTLLRHPEGTHQISRKAFFGNTSGSSNHCEYVVEELRTRSNHTESDLKNFYLTLGQAAQPKPALLAQILPSLDIALKSGKQLNRPHGRSQGLILGLIYPDWQDWGLQNPASLPEQLYSVSVWISAPHNWERWDSACL